tara:strand:+ start:14474 stop:14677 length:204 start_codon:yes stop_codon:yes gene_type:complete
MSWGSVLEFINIYGHPINPMPVRDRFVPGKDDRKVEPTEKTKYNDYMKHPAKRRIDNATKRTIDKSC